MITVEDYISIAKLEGHTVFYEEEYRPYNLNIVGVRNNKGRVNHFDDTINLYFQVKGEWVQKFYQATTMPGLPSLLNPFSIKGTAILKQGQYLNAYQKGVHKGKYEALVQRQKVTVYRDADLDAEFDLPNIEESGLFGINIHRASFGAKIVGPDSAGCQVIKHAADYKEFMYYIDKSLQYRANVFTYTLVTI